MVAIVVALAVWYVSQKIDMSVMVNISKIMVSYLQVYAFCFPVAVVFVQSHVWCCVPEFACFDCMHSYSAVCALRNQKVLI